MDSVINFVTALFVFVLMLDPGDIIFRLKLPLFALLLLLCIITYRRILVVPVKSLIVIYGVCISTSFIGSLRGINTDWEFGISIYKGFLMVFLLLWASNLQVLKKLYLPAVVIMILVLTTYVAMLMFPALETFIYGLTSDETSTAPILMSRRSFIGIDVVSVYYRTSPLCLFVAGVFLYRLLNKKGGFWANFLMSLGAISVLFLGGTRMNMLSALTIIGFVIVQKLWKGRTGRLMSIMFFLMGVLAVGFLLSRLLHDKGEESLEVKTVLSKAFYNEVNKDPWMLIVGQGPGATFDSLGIRGTKAVQSELTYQDLIRWFGIPFMIVIILVYIYPVWIIYKKRNKLEYSGILITAYILYLVIAGTNPLLISSTGMLAMLAMYSYAYNPVYENNLKSLVDNEQ